MAHAFAFSDNKSAEHPSYSIDNRNLNNNWVCPRAGVGDWEKSKNRIKNALTLLIIIDPQILSRPATPTERLSTLQHRMPYKDVAQWVFKNYNPQLKISTCSFARLDLIPALKG
jgi:hypothetical protein